MTDKLELKSSHEVVYTVDVADVNSIFYCKPTDPDILTVLMKDGKRLYCDEVCPVDSLQEEPNAKFKVGQTITDPTDSTFTFHINKIEDGRYIEKEDEWVLVKEADANYELVEEPVSIWHDSNEEQPNYASTVAIWYPKYKNGEIISRCTKVYPDRIWAYIDDLLKM